MALVLFFACLIEERGKFWIDKYFSIYLIYIFFYWLSTLVEGYAVEGFHRIVGDFFVAYVAYWSTRILCEKHHSLSVLVGSLLFIGFIDAGVTICQVFHLSFLDGFLNAFNLISYEPLKDADFSNREMMGLAIAGAMSSPVANGHLLMLVSILSLYFLNNRIGILYLFLFIILIVGSFFAQLRTSFFLAVILSLFVLYRFISTKRGPISIILLLGFFFLLAYGGIKLYGLIADGTNRYADLGLQLNDRDIIYSSALNFIGEHPLFGFYNTFVDVYKMYPHNFFLNAYLHSGILGFVAIMVLVFLQLALSIKHCLVRSKQVRLEIIVLSVAFIALFGNGMTHNISLASGDVMAWLIWGGLISESKKSSKL